MISSIRGRVLTLSQDAVVIEVGGLGVSVQCVPRLVAQLRVGSVASVATTLVVREDSLTLFGFADDAERDTFGILQSVSGIGPRTAQAVLATLTVDELARAVAADDLRTLSRPAGVGPRAAARIALELKDRLVPSPASGVAPAPAGSPDWAGPVVDGLVALGWPVRDARAAAVAVSEDAEAVVASGAEPSVPALLRAALRHLDRA